MLWIYLLFFLTWLRPQWIKPWIFYLARISLALRQSDTTKAAQSACVLLTLLIFTHGCGDTAHLISVQYAAYWMHNHVFPSLYWLTSHPHVTRLSLSLGRTCWYLHIYLHYLGNSQSASIHTDKLGADIYCEKSWLFFPLQNIIWCFDKSWIQFGGGRAPGLMCDGGGEHPYLFSYSRQDNEVLKYFHSCPQRRDKIASIKTKQSAWAKCGTKYVFKACCRFLMLFYFSRIYSASLTEIKMQEKSKVPACFSVWL